MAKKFRAPATGLSDGEAAKKVASKLRGVASQMETCSADHPRKATVIDAFNGAARALETGDPPSRHESLALVQLLIAGLEKMTTGPVVSTKPGANDMH